MFLRKAHALLHTRIHTHLLASSSSSSSHHFYRTQRTMASAHHDCDGEQRDRHQNVVVMRHGDRIDNFEPLWATTASRPWDPPLVDAGKIRAFSTGRKLRGDLGFPIHRVFASPFLRCLQTASEVVTALCAVDDDPSHICSSDGVKIDPSKIKVSVEYGLCELMNKQAIRAQMAPKDGDFGFNVSECEANLPQGTVDDTVERVYKELPKWEEPVARARDRYKQIIKALADKYPSENLLLVTHGEGVGVWVAAFMPGDVSVYEVEYCAYAHLQREVSIGKNRQLSAGEFEALVHGHTRVSFYPNSIVADDSSSAPNGV